MSIDQYDNTNFPNMETLYKIVRWNSNDILMEYLTNFNNKKNFTQDEKNRLESNINNQDVSYYNPSEILNLKTKIENFNREILDITIHNIIFINII